MRDVMCVVFHHKIYWIIPFCVAGRRWGKLVRTDNKTTTILHKKSTLGGKNVFLPLLLLAWATANS